ncbi:MAG TPA: F0F1 ATP synthase subunit beta, partial [Epsilonproteobacteria bacterium]|nr:F0F1 ATP synthase subunit beta [Campylobacterota bacterium]
MKGVISQVIGPVVDVDFTDYLPAINEAVEVNYEVEGSAQKLILEVAAHVGDSRVRTIAMDMSEGLSRGLEATALGSPIKVPVGEEVLGRIMNVIGDPIDDAGEVNAKQTWSIHRDPPPFEDQSTKSEIFETGIKVVDLL